MARLVTRHEMGAEAQSISIVIPARPRDRALPGLLKRIMGQARTPDEILLAIVGSAEGLSPSVGDLGPARAIEAGDRQGPALWNRACAEARSQLVVFLSPDAVIRDGDWLTNLTAPLTDPAVAAVYGRQRPTDASQPVAAFRLDQRYDDQPRWRRARFGDHLRYETIAFSLANAAIRRSVWQGIHFNEHLPIGADRYWARQVLFASYTIAYIPEASIDRQLDGGLARAFREAMLTGWTDQYLGMQGGSLLDERRHFRRRAAWHLLTSLQWQALPYVGLEAVAMSYGYRLGHQLHRVGPSVRAKLAPEVADEQPREPLTERERAA